MNNSINLNKNRVGISAGVEIAKLLRCWSNLIANFFTHVTLHGHCNFHDIHYKFNLHCSKYLNESGKMWKYASIYALKSGSFSKLWFASILVDFFQVCLFSLISAVPQRLLTSWDCTSYELIHLNFLNECFTDFAFLVPWVGLWLQ